MRNDNGSGRRGFERWSRLLKVASHVLKRLPDPVAFGIGRALSALPGRFGVAGRYLDASRGFASVGECVYLARALVVKNGARLSLGDRVSVHEFCYIDAAGGVSIGSDVSIAHACSFVSFEHTWRDADTPIKYNDVELREIRIGDDVWIGCGVRVLGGAVIENRVVVAAGSVVKGLLRANGIYAGVPARRIRDI